MKNWKLPDGKLNRLCCIPHVGQTRDNYITALSLFPFIVSFFLFYFKGSLAIMSDNKKIVNHNYTRRSEPAGGFKTMEEFYPFYLGEHCNKTNRRLHIIGK